MRIRLEPKPFNAAVRSIKKILKQQNPYVGLARIHFQIFAPKPDVWRLRLMATDRVRLAEDIIGIEEILDGTGPSCGEFDPPRLAAKSYVEIDVYEAKTVIAFDEVAFTYRVPRQIPGEKDPGEFLTRLTKDMKATTLQAERRASVCCSPRYLIDAASAFIDQKRVRIDIGGPTDIIALSGHLGEDQVFRAICPMRSSEQDPDYRARIAAEAAQIAVIEQEGGN